MRQATLLGVVLVILNEASQPEISYLAHQPLPHQDVGCPQVSVDVVHALHVGHALCYLVWGSKGVERWELKRTHSATACVRDEGPFSRITHSPGGDN